MTPPMETPVTFKSLGRDTRCAEVFRLAAKGKQHPDPAVAAAAHAWAHGARWNRLSNRLPGWLLPAAGLAIIAITIISGLPALFTLGGVIVVVLGLAGWISTSSARKLRAVYDYK